MHTTHQSIQDARMSIYVAGIPAKIDRKVLQRYFSQFGPSIHVQTFQTKEDSMKQIEDSMTCSPQMSSQDSAQHTASRVKGYCIVKTNNWPTFNNILSIQNHCIQGRIVMCTRFQEGNKLMRLNRLNNQRRVVVKKVPMCIDPHLLQKLINKYIGFVEVMYELKNNSTQFAPEISHSSKAYSIMFEKKEVAQELLTQGYLKFKAYESFTVERFKPFSKRKETYSLKSGAKVSIVQLRSLHNTVNGTITFPKPHCDELADQIKPTSTNYFEFSERANRVENENNFKFQRPEFKKRTINPKKPSTHSNFYMSGMSTANQEVNSIERSNLV